MVNWPLTLSIISLIIAGISAFYARRTVQAAKKANQITVHNEQLKIYKAFLQFQESFKRDVINMPPNDVRAFRESMLLSAFYFREPISNQIEEAYQHASQMLDEMHLSNRSKAKEVKNEHANNALEHMNQLHELLTVLNTSIRNELNLLQ